MVLSLDSNVALSKIDRVIAWALWAAFLLMTVSGYMITKGFINRYWGFVAHLELAIPAMLLFTVHFAIRLRFILLRWKMKEGLLLNLATLLVGLVLLLPILYLGFFFSLG
jgi:hypothetical protein